MRLLVILFALILVPKSFAATKIAMASLDKKTSTAVQPKAKLHVDATTIKQGGFFEVTVTDAKGHPTVWFNTSAYQTFKIAENKYRALVPVENLTPPGSYSILAKARNWKEKIPVKVLDSGKKIQHITLSNDKGGLTATNKEVNTIVSGYRTQSQTKLWSGKFQLPNTARKSSPFGVKRSYNKGPVTSYHKGLDFAANKGAPVLAPAAGIVVVEGYEAKGFHVHGNTVMLDHGQGVTSIYMHLSKINVKRGEKVAAGQKIGEVGHTGISTGPHLHWGVYLYGTSIDPEHFLSKSVN